MSFLQWFEEPLCIDSTFRAKVLRREVSSEVIPSPTKGLRSKRQILCIWSKVEKEFTVTAQKFKYTVIYFI